MDPLTPLETLCRIILRAREYEAQTPTDYDGNEAADNVDDEEEGTLSVLDDTINESVEEELKAILDDLAEDQLAEVLAFCWVGQGTYDAADWDEAMEEAINRGVPRDAAFDFLMGHINVQLAIVFEQIDWKMSEGAYHVIDQAMKRIFRPDWKGVFDPEEVKASVRGICNV